MGKIKVLPSSTVQRIAAGEVVQRPASAVKELLENSLDAKAHHISLKIEQGGKKLIWVQDDGLGMDKEDAQLALQRYATSKINNFADLNLLSTLGFRGEALPSIAAVSHFSLQTKSPDDLTGTLLEAEGGKIKKVTETGTPPGTIVEVKNLFYNIPARKKFLKSDGVEYQHILRVITREALCHPEVAFKLVSNGREMLNSPSQGNCQEKIGDFWSKEFAEQLIEIKAEDSYFNLFGFISKPFYTKKKSGSQYIFVNKRPVSSRMVVSALVKGYQPIIPAQRYPHAFLFIEIDPAQIDVNIHPSKEEIKFGDEKAIYERITQAVRNCLKEADLLPEVFFSQKRTEPRVISRGAEREYVPSQKISGKKEVQEEKAEYVPLLQTEEEIKAQLKNTYLVGEGKEGFFLLDQHAIHERIIFEQLKKGWAKKDVKVQNLLMPQTLELSREEASLLKEHLQTLKDLGFTLEPFGENTFLVRSLPSIIKKTSPLTLILDILEEIKQLPGKPSLETFVDKILIVIACRSAIKAGDKLKGEEIESLLRQWRKTEYPNYCPHGRPTVVNFSWKEVEKKFSRKL